MQDKKKKSENKKFIPVAKQERLQSRELLCQEKGSSIKLVIYKKSSLTLVAWLMELLFSTQKLNTATMVANNTTFGHCRWSHIV